MVTVTSTVPAEPAGLVAVIEVSLVTVNEDAAVDPNLTAVTALVEPAPVKPVPVIITEVPPVIGPAVGETLVTVGTGYNDTFNPYPVAQVKTGIFPLRFVPSVGNVVGKPCQMSLK